MDTDSTLEISRVGAMIWRLCNGQRSVAQIIEQVAGRYRVDPDVGQRETLTFLEMLDKRKLLRWQDVLAGDLTKGSRISAA